MKQTITIVKVGGRSADAVLRLFHEIQQKAGSTLQPGELPGALDRLQKWLEDTGNAPPILFFARYFDLWSAGD